MPLRDFTIIVPTRNEARNILPFLGSLPPAASLIVVDASRDGTADVVRRQRPENTTVLSLEGNIAAARQAGAEAARSPWLVYSDADVVFAPDYFERLVEHTPNGAAYGPKLSRDAFAGYYCWFARGQRLLHRLGVPAASGSNLVVRRQALAAVGGFDRALSCTEDTELAWRLKRRGFEVGWAGDLVVYARDHRRLERGVGRKLAHSALRGTLLYLNLMPSRWRRSDQGYWNEKPRPGAGLIPRRHHDGSQP
jgi:glycosyltransferase involved in cell wall biosynthesis